MPASLRTNPHIAKFRRTVWRFYRAHGRDLPWRRTHDPYHILISEFMLQQTQVGRVLPKYQEFLEMFPDVSALAGAPLSRVLLVWSGLGYNRRAKLLKRAIETIHTKHGGRVPSEYHELVALPGIGPYTAAAIMAFAYNAPGVVIETNIRTAFIHHFFPDHERVHDRELIPYIEATLPRGRAREWYAALMDYGSYVKRSHGNAGRRSAHRTRQPAFEGSNRQLRGAIIRELTRTPSGLTGAVLARRAQRSRTETSEQLRALVAEGLLVRRSRCYALAE